MVCGYYLFIVFLYNLNAHIEHLETKPQIN